MTSKEKEGKSDMKLWAIAIALVLLIVLSGVQAFELMSLKGKVNNELPTLIKTASEVKASAKSTTGSNTLQKSLSNLPQMVGGC